MGYLHQVINLRALADARLSELAPVDAGARADVHVVTDLHRPHVRQALVAALVEVVAKARGADDGVRADATVRSDAAAALHHRARQQDGVLADDHVGLDDRTGAQHGPRADTRARADARGRADGGIGGHLGRGVHGSAGVNADFRQVFAIADEPQQASHGRIHVGYADQRQGGGGAGVENNGRPGLRAGQVAAAAGIGHEGNVVGPGGVQRGNAANGLPAVAFDLAAHAAGQFLNGYV